MSKIEDFYIEGDVLVRYKGNEEDVVVPAGVRVVGESAFAEAEYTKSIALPKTVERIENRAFRKCEWLKKLSLPCGLKHIGI